MGWFLGSWTILLVGGFVLEASFVMFEDCLSNFEENSYYKKINRILIRKYNVYKKHLNSTKKGRLIYIGLHPVVFLFAPILIMAHFCYSVGIMSHKKYIDLITWINGE